MPGKSLKEWTERVSVVGARISVHPLVCRRGLPSPRLEATGKGEARPRRLSMLTSPLCLKVENGTIKAGCVPPPPTL